MTNYEGYIRVASASPKVTVADVNANCGEIIRLMQQADKDDASLVVFPELCLTGYTCADLFHNEVLLSDVRHGLEAILKASSGMTDITFVIGMPMCYNNALYNCAAVICDGEVLGIVPKSYLPGYNEFYERRWFNSGLAVESGAEIDSIPFGTDLLFKVGDISFGIEICEDLWVPNPPSISLALSGAEIILNLSASDDIIGKYHYLTELLRQQSARCLCAYAYASAGYGESSTDLVFDAKLLIAENNTLLAHNERWTRGNQLITADVDVEAIRRDRMHLNSLSACATATGKSFRYIDTHMGARRITDLRRYVDPHPFVPSSDRHLRERCEEIIHIQTAALSKRLDATGCKNLVIGISGGLDSTLALLVAVRAFDSLGLDRRGIRGITMPGFGTTGRTHENALKLLKRLNVATTEISIIPAVQQHFTDIGHDATVTDVTYENCQARERTQILMDLANKYNGMVLGTGDLSELALGWATYNGDHMSMYGVNAGIPKTLVRHLVRYFANEVFSDDTRAVLLDIVDTPISPELTPAASDGTIAQKTEDLVGPYELHDFFLYYTLRFGFGPRRIYSLAVKAFSGCYDEQTILRWLKTFFRRFFSQQFKRSCLPDGPKVGSICLSPRGDWRMPSDATAAAWLRQLDCI